jgi:hypothetical protein
MTAGQPRLETLIAHHQGVLATAEVLAFLTRDELRWRIVSGRWQRPCRGVVVTHSGPLTDQQLLRVALQRWGPQAALAGLTAARIDKFTGFGDKIPVGNGPIYVLAPLGSKRRQAPLGLNVVVHTSRLLTERDVHPLRQPRRTRVARSLVDAAEWMRTDRGAMAVVAAGVQQGLVRVDDLRAVLGTPGVIRQRRGLLFEVLGDVEGGAHALSELDFSRNVIRRYRLPEPSRQIGKRDAQNKQRWIDVTFEEWKVLVEIDGAQHIEPLNQWDDMERDNDFSIDGYRVLRFPAWLVRRDPEHVASKILEALRRAGYRE